MPRERLKIGIVGSGVAGLAATWLLNEYSDHQVHLYEKAATPGGHAQSIEFHAKDRLPCTIDVAFIAFNRKTYPNFCRFLDQAHIPVQPFDLSLAVSKANDLYEWGSASLTSLFCHAHDLFSPRPYRMFIDIIRFNLLAQRWLRTSPDWTVSLGDWINERGFSDVFLEDYLLPLTSGIWAVRAEDLMYACPALVLFEGMRNNQMLQLELPQERLHLSTTVNSINREEKSASTSFSPSYTLVTSDGRRDDFDCIILATHSNETARLLSENFASDEQVDLDSKLLWISNTVYAHTDKSFLPRNPKFHMSYNCLVNASKDGFDQTMTLNCNRALHLAEEDYGPVLLSLSPVNPPAPEKTLGKWTWLSPRFSQEAASAQRRLLQLERRGELSIAGAWTGWGFHEDGWVSGLRAVERLGLPGMRRPWGSDRSVVLDKSSISRPSYLGEVIEDAQLVILGLLIRLLDELSLIADLALARSHW